MELNNKNILLISTEPWKHIFVSKHHYASYLAKRGNKVFFLNPPSKIFSVSETEFKNVFSVDYQGFPPGLRFYPRLIQRYFIRETFQKLEVACDIIFEIVWSFDNSVFYDFLALPQEVIKISHIVDWNQNFQLSKAAITADICFCTSEYIKNKLIQFNPRVHKINHGFNDSSSEKDVQLPGKNKIKGFYAGNLDIAYLDWELFEKMIFRFQDVDFIFAGSWTSEARKQKLISLDNFFYLGQLSPQDLPNYYKKADVLLVCYRSNEYLEQLANPHKMMEYLGSGKMILATWTEEYSRLCERGLILMCKSNDEYLKNFCKIIKSVEYWNATGLKQRRIEIAKENTYQKQIDKIQETLKKYGN